jgi:hypothetical protein
MWGLIYLSAIPFFAFVYWRLPNDQFYHSTIQYEQILNSDAGTLAEEIHASIVENFRLANHEDLVEISGWQTNITELKVLGIKPTADLIAVKMLFTAVKQTGKGSPMFTSVPFEAQYSPSERNFMIDPKTKEQTFFKVLSFSPAAIHLYPPNDTFPYDALFPSADGTWKVPVLRLSKALNDKLQGFWRATRGLPSNVSGGFWRMLYLSAVTITTVGYGDIVPLTTTARMLVACEATLGIVFIGLFLNALVRQRDKQRDAQSG